MTDPMTVKYGQVLVAGQPLIFFHYHGLTFLNRWLYEPAFRGEVYGIMPPRLRAAVYGRYISEIKATMRWLRGEGVTVDAENAFIRRSPYRRRIL